MISEAIKAVQQMHYQYNYDGYIFAPFHILQQLFSTDFVLLSVVVFESEDKIMHDPLLIRYFISTSPKEAQLTHAGKSLDSANKTYSGGVALV